MPEEEGQTLRSTWAGCRSNGKTGLWHIPKMLVRSAVDSVSTAVVAAVGVEQNQDSAQTLLARWGALAHHMVDK